ncbi:MAG: taurine catabolism dioxygenase [Sphingomonadaceae bacterium PASS1]|jgi:alpha-ketoglutarate-dependent taurine dioxygenase|nr:MAG: taurine catabolism dioxygenase [Sphingomonadaceae bacterium PASS1]
MSVAELTEAKLHAEPIKEKIGTRVFNTKSELLSGNLSEQLLERLENTGILVFPELNLTDDEQVAFTDVLGGSVKEIGGAATKQGVFKVSLDKKINYDVAEYLMGSMYWHIDGTMNPVPIRASMLTAKVLTQEGGDTEFANTASSYADLDEATKAKIADLRVVHSLWRSQLFHTPEPTMEQLERWQGHGEAELPLVCKHKSGRHSLVLGNTAHYVIGVEPKESYRILHGLRNFATSEPYMYTHKWNVGDTIIWDNRTSLHRATPYDPDAGRMMHRTILQGTEAWEN